MAVVTQEDVSKKSDEEIFESMCDAMFDSDHYKHCVTQLQLRYMSRTRQATNRLVIATWSLVIATAFLVVGTIIPLVL